MLITPNTRTSPTFRTQVDAELTKKIYQRVPVLVNERTKQNPWGVRFATMFHMSNDSHLFRSEPGEGRLPLYEAKFIWHFTHRWATFEGSTSREMTTAELADPHCTVTPRYWVERAEVDARLAGRWEREWVLVYRDVTDSRNERTVVSSLIPSVGIGNKAPLIMPTVDSAPLVTCLLSVLNSFVLDYVARQKIGGMTMNYCLPLGGLKPSPLGDGFSTRAVALWYTEMHK
jgi:hypothetical protein